jgi:hypothetical protein
MKTKILWICFFSSLILVLFHSPVFSVDSEWVTVEGTAPIENVTKNEARKQAIANARREAVEKVVGVDILSETMVINYNVSGDVIRTIPHGKVIGQEIITEEIELIPAKNKGEAPYLAYKIKMRAKVIKEKGQSDVFFRLEAELNRTVFREGDLMKIKVTPSRDCYLSIFNILEDETAIILFPNRFKQNNFVKANATFTFPDDSDRKKGITLEAFLVEGKEKADEIIHILALKEPLQFNTARFKEGIFGIYDGRSAMVNDLVKNIVGIPLSHRAEKFIQYRITK